MHAWGVLSLFPVLPYFLNLGFYVAVGYLGGLVYEVDRASGFAPHVVKRFEEGLQGH